jgi:hypothetical protein
MVGRISNEALVQLLTELSRACARPGCRRNERSFIFSLNEATRRIAANIAKLPEPATQGLIEVFA